MGVLYAVLFFAFVVGIAIFREYVRRRAAAVRRARIGNAAPLALQAGAAQEPRFEASPRTPPSTARPEDSRTVAWAELHVATTPASRLAEIAAAHPEFAAQISAHPNAYPDLRAWAAAAARMTPGPGAADD